MIISSYEHMYLNSCQMENLTLSIQPNGIWGLLNYLFITNAFFFFLLLHLYESKHFTAQHRIHMIRYSISKCFKFHIKQAMFELIDPGGETRYPNISALMYCVVAGKCCLSRVYFATITFWNMTEIFKKVLSRVCFDFVGTNR